LGAAYREAGLDFKVIYIPSVHNVKAVVPMSFNLHGAFRSRPTSAGSGKIEAPHSFKFCLRDGLSAGMLLSTIQKLPAKVCKHGSDVFVFVKQFMSDCGKGKGTLIFPGEWAEQSATFCRVLSQVQGLVGHINICVADGGGT
jgi:hypothetical protein